MSHVDVLSVTEHTPLLEGLALTVMESVSTLFLPVVIDLGIVGPFGEALRIPLQYGRYMFAS